MRPTLRVGIAAASLVLLAGCSSDTTNVTATSSVRATTVVGGTPDRSASPSTPSREDAAVRYLEIVRPYNEALEEFEQAINSGRSLGTLTALAEATAAANEEHVEQLEAAVWPTDIRAPIDDLIHESIRAQQYWDLAAQASSRNELIEAVLAAGQYDGTTAANAIRDLLRLDDYDEADYSD